MANNYLFQINVNGNAIDKVGTLNADFTQLVTIIDKVDNSVNQTFGGLQSKIKNINLSSVISQVRDVAEGIAAITGPGVGFEQSMADFSSITGTVGNDLVELGKVARRTGIESGLGAEQAARAFSILASQIEVGDIGLDGLKELQRNSITLAHAAGISMDEAANALAGTINQYGLEAGEAARVINVLAAGSKYGAAEINDLAQSFKVVGAQASIAGLSVEDTAGAIEVMSKNNIKGAEAGTDLRNIILAMQTTLGIDFSKTSLAEALDTLKPKLNDAAFMSQTFGRMSMASAQFLVKNADAVADMTGKVTGTNTAMEQAATRTDTLAQKMAVCRAFVDNLKIGILNLTGGFAGYAALIAEQAVTVSQLLPLFSVIGKITKATKLWTQVQWLLNAAFVASPIGWIVVVAGALAATIAVLWNKCEGFRQVVLGVWEVMKEFGRLLWDNILGTVKNLIGGIGALGSAIGNLFKGNFEQAAKDAKDGVQKLFAASPIGIAANVVVGATKTDWGGAWDRGKAAGSESWQRSQAAKEVQDTVNPGGKPMGVKVVPELVGGGLDLNLTGKSSGGSKSGGSGVLDLNQIVPNLKGSTAYSAIARRLAPVAMAASVAMPLTVAATTLPQDTNPIAQTLAQSEYPAARGARRGGVTMQKFCDQIVINIAKPDGRGMDEIRGEITKVLDEMLDSYET